MTVASGGYRWCGLSAGPGRGPVDPVSDRVCVGHVYAAAAGDPSAVRAQSGYAPPREFLVTGMTPVQRPVEPQEKVDDQPRVVIGETGAPCATSRWPPGRCWSRRRAGGVGECGCRRWRRCRSTSCCGGCAAAVACRLREESRAGVPGGRRTARFHAQRVYALNMLEGNCGVVGVGNSGKTVAMTTMITGAALMYGPQRIQFYVLSLSGPEINGIAGLPHVGSFARGSDSERVTRTLAELEALIEDREQAFKELGRDGPAAGTQVRWPAGAGPRRSIRGRLFGARRRSQLSRRSTITR